MIPTDHSEDHTNARKLRSTFISLPSCVLSSFRRLKSSRPAGREDGGAALAVIVGSIVLAIVVLVGTVSSVIGTLIGEKRNHGCHQTNERVVYVGQ
jgi:hypothetical protein